MEASKLVSDDEHSSETQTATSASKDQVESDVPSQQKESSQTDIKINSFNFTKRLKFLPREIEFLNRHRNKTRLCDPKGVYEFRHIQQTWAQSLLQLITMLISLVCMLGLSYWAYQESKEVIVGVGEVSSLTWINVFEVVMTVGIIFIAIKKLGKQAKQHPQNRYRLAMMANAFNRMLFNNLRLMLIVFIPLIIITMIVDPTLQSIDLERFEEGAAADLIDAMYSLVSIVICFRAFRFCGKELTA